MQKRVKTIIFFILNIFIGNVIAGTILVNRADYGTLENNISLVSKIQDLCQDQEECAFIIDNNFAGQNLHKRKDKKLTLGVQCLHANGLEYSAEKGQDIRENSQVFISCADDGENQPIVREMTFRWSKSDIRDVSINAISAAASIIRGVLESVASCNPAPFLASLPSASVNSFKIAKTVRGNREIRKNRRALKRLNKR